MRAGGALVGALIWSQMCLSLVLLALPSPGNSIYAVLNVPNFFQSIGRWRGTIDAISDEAFAALGAYPIIQSAVAITILPGALYLVVRATRDKPVIPRPLPPHEPVPQWLMIGPIHDMIGAVHDVAEQSRRTNELLREIKDLQRDTMREFQNARQTLELIRNESRLR